MWIEKTNKIHFLYLITSIILFIFLLTNITTGITPKIFIVIVSILGILVAITSIVSLINDNTNIKLKIYAVCVTILVISGSIIGNLITTITPYILLLMFNVTFFEYGRIVLSNINKNKGEI